MPITEWIYPKPGEDLSDTICKASVGKAHIRFTDWFSNSNDSVELIIDGLPHNSSPFNAGSFTQNVASAKEAYQKHLNNGG